MVLVAVLASPLVGCGDGDADVADMPVDPSTSVPFSIEAPEGFDLVTAGRGNAEHIWGWDCCGTEEPYTVLAPNGSIDGGGVVIVSTTGFASQEGGLAQSNRGYIQDSREEFSVDGQPAHYFPGTPAGDGAPSRWSDLTVQRGRDLAVSIGAESATREEMLAVAEQVEVPDDRLEAPLVMDPPGELQVVGSVDADIHPALTASAEPSSDHVPGSDRSHTIAWHKGGVEIVAITLPPDSVDVAALAAHDMADSHRSIPVVEQFEVDGRPAAAIELPYDTPQRAVVVDRPFGAVVVVASGDGAPSHEVLADLAATAEPLDRAAWETFVIEATGG